MELRDIDVNEAPEPTESSTVEMETVQETVVEKPEIAEVPAEKPTTEETVQTQEEEQTPAPTEVTQPKKSRAEDRIRNLVSENKILQEKIKNFSEQQSPLLQNEEIGYDDLNKVINERALQAAELLIASKEVESQASRQFEEWSADFENVKKENPQLDPNSSEYDADLDNTLARLLDDGSGIPRVDILVSDVIKTFKKREAQTEAKAKEEGKNQATATLAKQMSEGAITPTSQAPAETVEYTDEKLAELRVKNPKEYMKIIDRI